MYNIVTSCTKKDHSVKMAYRSCKKVPQIRCKTLITSRIVKQEPKNEKKIFLRRPAAKISCQKWGYGGIKEYLTLYAKFS